MFVSHVPIFITSTVLGPTMYLTSHNIHLLTHSHINLNMSLNNNHTITRGDKNTAVLFNRLISEGIVTPAGYLISSSSSSSASAKIPEIIDLSDSMDVDTSSDSKRLDTTDNTSATIKIDESELDVDNMSQYIPTPKNIRFRKIGNRYSLTWDNDFSGAPICKTLKFLSKVIYYKIPKNFKYNSEDNNLFNYEEARDLLIAYEFFRKPVAWFDSPDRNDIPPICWHDFPAELLTNGSYIVFVCNYLSSSTAFRLISTIGASHDVTELFNSGGLQEHAIIDFTKNTNPRVNVKFDFNYDNDTGILKLDLPPGHQFVEVDCAVDVKSKEDIYFTRYFFNLKITNNCKSKTCKIFLKNLPDNKDARVLICPAKNANASIVQTLPPGIARINMDYTTSTNLVIETPIISITRGTSAPEATCCICLQSLEEGQSVSNLCSCTHFFHDECLENLAKATKKRECCMCRTSYKEIFYHHACSIDFNELSTANLKTFNVNLNSRN